MKKLLLLTLCALLAVAPAAGCGRAGQTTVNFLNWGDYIDPDVIPLFEKEHPDIKINLTTVESNEAMYVATSTEGSQIDVIIPSEYMIQRMMLEDMLAALDISKMENVRYVQDFAAATCDYDPVCNYSAPYAWGTFGILYNETMVDGPVNSWDILFDEAYAGKVLMYDSMRDSLGVALIRQGSSINSKDKAEIDAAADMLIAQKPMVLGYGTEDLRMSMASGSAALAVTYAGDAVYSMADSPDLRYVIPQEGANIFVDSLCILKNTAHYDAALQFVDFMLRPDIAAKNAAYTGYSTPEDAALEYLDEEIMANTAFNPPAGDLVNCEYYEHLEPEVLKLYEEAWVRVKTA
jgi:spermidine/putrescine transport system substrate-binding protein